MSRFSYSLIIGLLFGLSAQAHAGLSPSKETIHQIVVDEAQANGMVPVSIALAVARVESNFNATAESHVGARGVMQIMPKTARDDLRVSPSDLWDPRVNVKAGVRYLASLYKQYGYRWDAALSHYNGGTLKGNPYSARPHTYTRDYVRKVMRFARQYEREDTAQDLIQLAQSVQQANDIPYGEDVILKEWRPRDLYVEEAVITGEVFDATNPPEPSTALVQWTDQLAQQFRRRLASHNRTWLTERTTVIYR